MKKFNTLVLLAFIAVCNIAISQSNFLTGQRIQNGVIEIEDDYYKTTSSSILNFDENVKGVVTPDQVLRTNESLVLYGANKDLQKFLKREIE